MSNYCQPSNNPCQETCVDTQADSDTKDAQLGPGGVPKGAHTSEYYRCKPMPKRFDNPDWFQSSYGPKRTPHPMYRTTNAEYGSRPPTVHTMQTSYHTMSQEFTSDLGKCGMYRNRSLNCSMDKSVVPEF
jgi:hypothetical protein